MSKLAICTIVVNNFDNVFALTGGPMQAYADRCGAELIIKRETQMEIPCFAKYELFAEVAARDEFDRVLYLDADVYCRKTAPDIFQTYKFSAARREWPNPKPYLIREATDWIRKHLDPHWDRARYYNAGILLFDYASLMKTARALEGVIPKDGRFYDQDQLNWILHGVGFPDEDLPLAWNAPIGPAWHTLIGDYRNTHFLHGTAVKFKDKAKKLKEFIEKYP